MASVKGLSVDQLKSKINELKAQGKSESTSKSLGKYVDALKVLQPDKYGADQVASAKLKLSSSTDPDTQVQLGIANPSSSSGLAGGFSSGQPGGINLNDIYNNELNSPELKALQDELNAKKTARDAAEADINDNPYYSEATRVGRISKLDQKALNEINTLQGQVDAKKADALVKVNIATQQYNIEDKQYQNNLQKLNLLISSGAITGASSNDISQIAMATGMSTDMVKSIIDTTKQGQIQTSVTTNTDDNGNVTVSVINNKTGEVISQNSLGAVGNKQTGGSGKNPSVTETIGILSEAMDSVTGSDGHVSESAYLSQRNFASSLGISPAEFDKIFAVKYVNPNYYDSYKIVDSNIKQFFEG